MEHKDMIKELKHEIAARKLMVKALKAEEKAKNKKPFTASCLFRSYLKVMDKVTSPVRDFNSKVKAELEHPGEAAAMKAYHHAGRVLKQAQKIETPNDKWANKCAAALIDLENKYRGIMNPEVIFPFSELKDEIRRLRSQESKNEFEDVFNSALNTGVHDAI